jgi:peroxiredoxin
MRQRGVGTLAPALELPTAAGVPWSLDAARGRSVLLSFLGPANCLFCRAHVIRLIQARDHVVRLGAEVVLVAYHDPELVMAKMMHSLNLPFVLLVDETKSAYARWGLGRVGVRTYLHPGLYWGIARMVFRRETPLGDVADESQMGGDFVVDRDGRLAFVNRLRSLHDRARVDDLLAVVERLSADARPPLRPTPRA